MEDVLQIAYVFGRYELNPVAGSFKAAGEAIELRPKTFDVLHYLVQNAGRLVAKEELFEAVWRKAVVTDDSLVQCVHEIRQALGDDRQQLIRTIPRRGYIFTPAAKAVPALALALSMPQSAARTSEPVDAQRENVEPMPIEPGAIGSRKRGWQFAAVALVLAGAGSLLALKFDANQQTTARAAARDAGAAAVKAPLSIVVLPLAIPGGDTEQAIFADGVTRDMATSLSRIPESFVISPNTALTYRGSALDVRQIGRELGVRYALEGSLRTLGDQVRLNISLVDTRNGNQLWADQLDASRSALEALNREITGRVARKMHLKIVEAEAARGLAERPANPQAHDLTMRGWELQYRERPESVAQARLLFQRALEIDSRSVTAWAGLAAGYHSDIINKWVGSRGGSREEWRQLQETAAKAAYALDPEHALANHEWGIFLAMQGKLEQALACFEKESSINRNDPYAYLWLAVAHLWMGNPQASFAPTREAIRLSPRDAKSYNFYNVLAYAHLQLGEYAEAVAAARKAVGAWHDSALGHAALAAAAAQLGDTQTARAAVSELARLLPGYTIQKWRAEQLSKRPAFLAQRERFFEGLRKAGVPSEPARKTSG